MFISTLGKLFHCVLNKGITCAYSDHGLNLKSCTCEKKYPIYFIDFLLFFHLHLIKINIFSLSLKQFMQCD